MLGAGRHHKVNSKKLPWGAWLLSYLGVFNFRPSLSYRAYILVLTFLCYTCYHMSRKPFSVVANVLAPNCSKINTTQGHHNESDLELVLDEDYSKGWPPFNVTHCKSVIGAVDYSWLFTYAVFLTLSGVIADRVNLRYFLTVGMIGSGVFVGILGVAYYGRIHNLAYFVVIQIFVGIFESTGWPGVVATMGNWFGKQHRGLVLGIWNAHTSVGNILGTVVPSIWARNGQPWGWSFFVPGFVMIFMGIVIFLFLVVDPNDVGLPPPKHQIAQKSVTESNRERIDINTSDEQGKDDEVESYNEKSKLIKSDKIKKPKEKAISLIGALKVPGVIEFALALFFSKLVAYTFLFWLPYYIAFHKIAGKDISKQDADFISPLYDVGGIIGSIFTGLLSDLINARAISCVIMSYSAVPTLFLYRYFGQDSLAATMVLISLCGLFINGPYALITTAVSNDLGTHKSLKENQRAKATVGAFIDGTGSLGAAFGPLITGAVSDNLGWDNAFYVLMASCFLSSLMLTRLLVKEIAGYYQAIKEWKNKKTSLIKW